MADPERKPVPWADFQAAQAEANRRSLPEAPPPPPTPEQMMARSIEDLGRLEFGLTDRVWNKWTGKEGRVFDIKFDKLGNPTYRIQLPNGVRTRAAAPGIHEEWSAQRVYFPVDLETGRPILPARA